MTTTTIDASTPCIPVPIPSLPTVPSPFSLTAPAIPQITAGFNACCNLISFSASTPPIALPPLVMNPAIVVLVNKMIAVVQAYIDNLPPRCARQ